ncbi:cytochrome P450, partial [Rhexocercosporidium sp. MPI-PUGE-AT-0058]
KLRTAFTTRRDINMATLSKHPYLNAVPEECLCIFPPSAFNQARIVPAGGANKCGRFVPAGVAVGVATWAASRSKRNWSRPDMFKLERWLGEPLPGDDRTSVALFLGLRNCLDILAYAEMRLILSQLLLGSEYDLGKQSKDWITGIGFTCCGNDPLLTIKLRRRMK